MLLSWFRTCAVVIACAIWVQVSSAVVLPDDPNVRISLNGQWRFKLEQDKPIPATAMIDRRIEPVEYPSDFEKFYLPDYREGDDWHDITVPGNWEIAGFSPVTYGQPGGASGFYRLQFDVPKGWSDRRVMLNCDGVQCGAQFWLNGQPVNVDESSWSRANYHEGGTTAFQVDLTPAVKFGQKNLLALRVTKNTRSVDMDIGDSFFLGGIHRAVTLFAVPKTYFNDITVRTGDANADHADVRIMIDVANCEPGTKPSVQLQDQPAVDVAPDAKGHCEITLGVANPRLWSAEFPELYTLSVDLKTAGGEMIEHTSQRIGIRNITIKDGVFLVNGTPVKLAGMCRHEIYPTLGTAINEAVWRKDLELMKAANVNAIRTSHYPYGAGFYDLCDSMGFYVLDEIPCCSTNMANRELTPAMEQRTRETIRRDKNHPCVVIWGIGNENTRGINNQVAADLLKTLDPTRPRLTSWFSADEGHVDLDDAHYRDVPAIARAEHDPRRAKWPMIYSENPNMWDVQCGADFGSLDRWGEMIERTWREIWQDQHIVGSFLWEWQDRVVIDQCPTKLYGFDPVTGVDYIKLKGLVDGWRNPRPDYYHVKMAYAPIRLEDSIQMSADEVRVEASNRYSFTDLSTLMLHWKLLRENQTIGTGTAHVPLAPRSSGIIRLNLPGELLSKADTLETAVDHPGGWNVATYRYALKSTSNTPPQIKPVSELMFPHFNLVTFTNVPDRMGWHTTQRTSALLQNISLCLANENDWKHIEPQDLWTTPVENVRSIEAEVAMESDPIASVGSLRVARVGDEFRYTLNWWGKRSDVQELGWIFESPGQCSRFSWDRKSLWSYYPDTHIGRPHGTATPDSAGTSLIKMTRPDLFDFNSTKYDCNWASLTDSQSRGLCVHFAPDERHHVRAELGANGTYRLVVNRQCSPPRDYSSSVVPDLYLMLNENQQVTGRFFLNSRTHND